MTRTATPWQATLARLECAGPFLPEDVNGILAQRSLRRMWRAHRETAECDLGEELMRSHDGAERHRFLHWVSHAGHEPLAAAARLALTATGVSPAPGGDAAADRALMLADELAPSPSPLAMLATFLSQLSIPTSDLGRQGEIAPRAVSLAIAVRPGLFGLQGAPLALAGIASRALGLYRDERDLIASLDKAVEHAVRDIREDFVIARHHPAHLADKLEGRPFNSAAAAASALLVGLGPMTRSQIARALGMSGDAATKALRALDQEGLVTDDNELFEATLLPA